MTTLPANQTSAFDQIDNALPVATNPDTEAFGKKSVFAIHDNNPAWLSETIKKLDKLSALEEDWDSYGAAVIDIRSIENAQRYIRYLAMFVGVEEPAIGATPDGEAGLSWDGGHWSLDADILPDGRINYVYTNDRDASLDTEKTISVSRDLYDLLSFLTAWE